MPLPWRHKASHDEPYNFHDDATLKSGNSQPPAWNSNIPGDIWALAEGALTATKSGVGSAAKKAISTLDIDDPLSQAITKKMVSVLWGSMLHPPLSYRGDQMQYRSADGSYNNMLFPALGQAGRPYAKSVQSVCAKRGAKPEPGDLFDLLLARTDDGHESETGMSSMVLYQATIVIHDIFRSNDYDRNISDTSSYLDLSPLYGKDQEAQNNVRLFRNGLLKPDTFAEHRLMNQPPAVSIFLIMYNRFHNYVAETLLLINDNDKFTLPSDHELLNDEEKERAKRKQDQDLFQTARLITCGLYAQIAIHDYLRCLMMIHEVDTAWTLDPRTSFPHKDDKRGLSRGEGNEVSVEFNLLYRFHSPISKRDADWSKALFELWLGRDIDDNATPEQVARGEKLTSAMLESGDVPISLMRRKIVRENESSSKEMAADKAAPYFPLGLDRVGGDFSDLKSHPERQFVFRRDENGMFNDAQLVAELVRASEDPICSWGARGIPKIFKSIEVLGILQARKWEVATLNEFREFFGMSRHKRFEDINSDPKIQQALRDLYDHPDMVELYPGYIVEGNGRSCDPSDSCPNGETPALWRGVFSDAVTLVRSDRFYTIDWNVDSITAWGMEELTSDPKINKGGMLHKLYHRAFPNFFSYNSLHLWQPYYTPAKNILLAQEQGHIDALDLDGLEYQYEGDNDVWLPLTVERSPSGKVTTNFRTLADKELQTDSDRQWRVRRVMEEIGSTRWRGSERAKRAIPKPHVVTNYTTIREQILGGKDASGWKSRDLFTPADPLADDLQRVLTHKQQRSDDAWQIISKVFDSKQAEGQIIRAYFDDICKKIRLREQRNFSRHENEELYQLDVVRDFAIPVVTCFTADLVGFWDRMKTPAFPAREFDENEIYRHIENCHDYLCWDTDATKTMKRRLAVKSSRTLLTRLSRKAVSRSSAGLMGMRNWNRKYGGPGDSEAVKAFRRLAVEATQTLMEQGYSRQEVASVLLAFALETSRMLVIEFTETLAYFVDPQNNGDRQEEIPDRTDGSQRLSEIQELVNERDSKIVLTTDDTIHQYILEARRLNTTLKLAFRWAGDSHVQIESESPNGLHTIQRNDQILVDLQGAGQDAKLFPSPSSFRIDRPLDSYFGYGIQFDAEGAPKSPSYARRLSLAALTGMIKHMALLEELRPAHGKAGQLKRVNRAERDTGLYQARYMNSQWNAFSSFPSTWNLRYNGKGKGVWPTKKPHITRKTTSVDVSDDNVPLRSHHSSSELSSSASNSRQDARKTWEGSSDNGRRTSDATLAVFETKKSMNMQVAEISLSKIQS